MCGILGSTATYHTEMQFKNATRALLHRGPDFQGTYRDDDIFINHLLLAIRGTTEESKQPVWNSESPWVLAFNGQIYNTKQISNELGESSEVDTVLLYKLIQKFGWDFIQHIHGMYAIALYNREEKVVCLYRDPSGQKCLYYRTTENRFDFASEIKGILSLPGAKRRIDPFSILLAESIGYLPGDRTIVQDVQKLLPGEIVTYDLVKKIISRKLFDTRDPLYFGNLNAKEVLERTVEEHLQSKRDIAINLSGGLDSSLLFHEAVQSGRNITAFSTSFDITEGNYNRDAELAERLAHDYGQQFHKIEVTRDSYLENFIESYKTIEEPNFNISIPIYYQTARTEGIHGEGLRVVLSGDGGDEIFGGYPHYAEMGRLAELQRKYSAVGLNLYKWYRNHRYSDYREPADVFYELRGFRKTWGSKKLNHREILTYLHTTTDKTLALYAEKNDDIYRLMLFDRFVWLASENFIRSDKLYMRQSMEMRCPLAYQPLRTFMDTHIHSDEYIGKDTNKIFLRNLYTNKLPDYIVKRKDKTGWRAPVSVWYDKTYKDLFLSIISEMKQSDTLDWTGVKKHIESKESWPGKTAHLYLSLALIIIELGLEE